MIQRSPTKFLHIITYAYPFRSESKMILEVIQDYAVKQEERLRNHISVEDIQLLDLSHELKRLKQH